MEPPSSFAAAQRGPSSLFPELEHELVAVRSPRAGSHRHGRIDAVPDPALVARGEERTCGAIARESWNGLEELRADVRAALARHACRGAELDDVVQEALLRAARYRGSLTDVERLRAWVIRIALNVMRDHLRRDLRLPRIEESEDVFARTEGREAIPGEDSEDESLEAEGVVFDRAYVLRHLDEALSELPRMDQRVLGAWYAPPGDLRALHVRESMSDLAKVRAFRARNRLTRLLRRRLALDVVDPREAAATPLPSARLGARRAGGEDRSKKERDANRRARS